MIIVKKLLNEKGFAISGIIYPLFVLFVGLLIGMIAMFMNRKMLFDQTKKDVLSEVNYGKNILEGGLLLYYKGSEAPITVDGKLKLPDVSGNGNHGEMINFQENMRNEKGKIAFDGTNNYVAAPNVLKDRTTFTIEIAYVPKRQISWQYYFGIRVNQFGLEAGSDNYRHFYYSNSNGTNKYVFMDETTNNLNQITYATYVINGNQITGYKDGKRMMTRTMQDSIITTGDVLGLGADGLGQYKALMDCYSFRVYNYALNDEEVYHNYRIDYSKIKFSNSYTSEYVQSGLLMDLDGIYNGRTEHVTNSSFEKGTWKDSSPNGNNCKLAGFGYTTASGWVDNGLVFDGADDTCIAGDLKPTKYTLSLAVKPINKSKRHVIFTRWYGYTLEINEDGSVSFGRRGGEEYLRTSAKVTFGTMSYITATFDGSTMILYLNGTQAATRSSNVIDYTTNSNDTRLSHNVYDTFKGTIYHAMMYDRALTASEVKQNYNQDKSRYPA